ncbi:DUF3108 domain-containing protein [Trinickia dinghuensis]|uniref:DUF3108 domain-containing protein n=1 Tax=Trinickia dinghuensis TaxID=2291023 RepID=A0A3D8K4P9_9BURK|nr:DUF3108 domain-containing protein [Trinickia dinghuensis]RDV00181.1 DUF3108 domain-containing protein [Trinickia dinghuensis]
MSYPFCSDTVRTAPPTRGTHRRAWRWGIALAGVLALHGVAVFWFARYHGSFAPEKVVPPVQVALLTPQPIARDTVRAAPRRPAVRTESGGAHEGGTHPPVLHALAPSSVVPPLTENTDKAEKAEAASATQSATAGPGNAAGASGAAAAQAAAPAQASAAAAGIRFSVPPSGDLHYNTFYNGVENAPGTIHWESSGDGYEMIVSVPLPFVGTFTYESHGRIDAFGLSPEHYIEKRGRRPEDVTTFDRADKRIGFTRTSTTLALPDGAQDRFSVVMQLASLVRGDPDAYKPGVTRSFYVADNDSGELWPIETIGDESIQTAEGYIQARHFMRLPRHDGDRRRIDVWLAPALGWLPVRIMQTEPNGSQIELVWRGPLRAPGAKNAFTSGETPDDASDAPAADTGAAEAGPAREHP